MFFAISLYIWEFFASHLQNRQPVKQDMSQRIDLSGIASHSPKFLFSGSDRIDEYWCTLWFVLDILKTLRDSLNLIIAIYSLLFDNHIFVTKLHWWK